MKGAYSYLIELRQPNLDAYGSLPVSHPLRRSNQQVFSHLFLPNSEAQRLSTHVLGQLDRSENNTQFTSWWCIDLRNHHEIVRTKRGCQEPLRIDYTNRRWSIWGSLGAQASLWQGCDNSAMFKIDDIKSRDESVLIQLDEGGGTWKPKYRSQFCGCTGAIDDQPLTRPRPHWGIGVKPRETPQEWGDLANSRGHRGCEMCSSIQNMSKCVK